MIFPRFLDCVARTPDKLALMTGRESLTYAGLQNRVEHAVAGLQALGVQPGDAVGVLLPNSIDFVVACLALFARGAVAIPVSTRFQADEVGYYLHTGGAGFVIHASSTQPNLLAGVAGVTRVVMEELAAGEAPPRMDAAETGPAGSVSALYMYSSGSTGKPKRITRTQAQLLAEYDALAATVELTANDRILCTVPLYHAHGFGNCMLAALLSGGTLVLTEGEFNPREAARLLDAERITIYPAVPFMLKMIGDAFYPARPDLSGVRLIFTAGAPLPADTVRRMREVFAVTPAQLYGSTETGAVAINYDRADGTEESVGRPLVGITIDILDEAGQVAAMGEMGEIAVRSPAMTRCYDDLPEQTRESFQNSYFLPGDLGCKTQDGCIYIKGRKKLLINVAGNKVDPLDVEALIHTHPAVTECVVLGCPDANYGEMVKAVIVTRGDCSEAEILDLCNRHLAWYKVPKRIEFRSEIPRSPLGKILRKYLQDELSEVK